MSVRVIRRSATLTEPTMNIGQIALTLTNGPNPIGNFLLKYTSA